jgi:mannose-6-phosphate isomerase-like protein (cupin superfamily)
MDSHRLTGARSVYRAPHEGIGAPADYPAAPVSRILDASTPGAELFAVLVAIGQDIPLHFHAVMELQFVLSGTGLALDADGGETPIGPGGAVISPAGPAGAHGFRNTGSLPLTLLCVYPSPGGATPGRSPRRAGTPCGPGPRSAYTAASEARRAAPDYPDAPVVRLLDETDPGAELFAVLVAIGGEIPLHHHPVMELQFVLSGTGLALDADGGETPIAPGGAVLSPAGLAGAHGFRNTGSLPLQLLCVYPSPGGSAPGRTPVEPHAGA